MWKVYANIDVLFMAICGQKLKKQEMLELRFSMKPAI